MAEFYLAKNFDYASDYENPFDPLSVNLTLDGFDVVACDRTSLRICGSVRSEVLGPALTAAVNMTDWLNNRIGNFQNLFGITDTSCPMGLWNSTARLTTVDPDTGAPDGSCMPVNSVLPMQCGADRTLWYSGAVLPFPNDDCDQSVGATPFAAEPYMEVVPGEELTLDCVNLVAVQPNDTSSACGRVTTLDVVHFWMYDDDFHRGYFDQGVVLRTVDAKSGAYTTRPLTVSWGPLGENVLVLSGLGLKRADMAALKPQVCFAHTDPLDNVWQAQTADVTGFVWSALYDSSGACCPTYYSNRF
ncbi:hypothetical protein HYH03_014621 [Edaphochlamys debaryana]|uniref:Pherophorin domain-containing protein n=1 Tax=Edaphochlamys debaryana TaxID=47281 RepID=A0A835XKX6_9CHLO|nr:hypothetical protein HYH03_014621 [Edaphochlamys debaryana]|eukprot:KAG2486692.1 hypothetical protein HYH03_014621 [Edaphochlamys debaryana]